MLDKIGFIGLGLIGGSLAKAFRKYDIANEIIAYDINHPSLVAAKNEGTLTDFSVEINESFSNCDIIFLCCPVKENINAITKLIPYVSKDCILTDVGSTKEKVTDEVMKIEGDFSFIGGHPMTGSEKSGYSASSPILFENAYYILTPTRYSQPSQIEKLKELLLIIDAIPIVIDADQHDYITATISHIPHIIASTLVNLVEKNDTEENYMHTFAAGGFKDITRIASSSPKMWQQICMSNQSNIVDLLEQFKSELTVIQNNIMSDDSNAIYNLFDQSKNYRDSFERKNYGNIVEHYMLTVDGEDKPGTFSQLASVLSENDINIKNMGILHNREHHIGIIEIFFYDKESQEKSYNVLKDLDYIVYKY